MTEAINPTYQSIQEQAKGPGVEEWKRADKARAELTTTYQSLKDDPRYTEQHKVERAWERYEVVKAEVEQLAPEATKKMLKSAESLERLSIPTPPGEGLITQDTNKLLLVAHERSRLEGLINRAEKAAEKGPWKANPVDILKAAYEQGLEKGGPGGGATVRAVCELARDWGLDIDAIVDTHRKPHHHGALENAQTRRMQAELISRSVPEPPFKRGGGPTATGTYSSGAKAFIPQKKGMLFAPKNRRAPWK